MLNVIDLITPVRVGAEVEEGLDAAMHGESAYALGGMSRLLPDLNGVAIAGSSPVAPASESTRTRHPRLHVTLLTSGLTNRGHDEADPHA
jgi:hypothetical protein